MRTWLALIALALMSACTESRKSDAELRAGGIEALLDDRDERPGVKFKDADLIGIPLRVTVGPKGLARGVLEVRRRADGSVQEIPVGEAAARLREAIG